MSDEDREPGRSSFAATGLTRDQAGVSPSRRRRRVTSTSPTPPAAMAAPRPAIPTTFIPVTARSPPLDPTAPPASSSASPSSSDAPRVAVCVVAAPAAWPPRIPATPTARQHHEARDHPHTPVPRKLIDPHARPPLKRSRGHTSNVNSRPRNQASNLAQIRRPSPSTPSNMWTPDTDRYLSITTPEETPRSVPQHSPAPPPGALRPGHTSITPQSTTAGNRPAPRLPRNRASTQQPILGAFAEHRRVGYFRRDASPIPRDPSPRSRPPSAQQAALSTARYGALRATPQRSTSP